jgi:hypothetical protein
LARERGQGFNGLAGYVPREAGFEAQAFNWTHDDVFSEEDGRSREAGKQVCAEHGSTGSRVDDMCCF